MSNILAVNDVIIGQFIVKDGSQIAVANRHWKVLSFTGAGIIQFQDVANLIDTDFAPCIKPLLYNGAEYRGARVRRLFPVGLDGWQGTNANSGFGSGGAVGLPKQTAGLIRFNGQTLGKHGMGRWYVPFPSTTANETDGKPTAAYQTLLDTLGSQAVINPYDVTVAGTTAHLTPVNFDRVAVTTYPVNQYTSSDRWATQKRRGDYGRTNIPPL